MRLWNAVPHPLLFWKLSSALLSFFLLSGPPSLQAGQFFSIENLGSLGSSAGTVNAINNSGLAVGFVTDSFGNQVPVTFDGQANPLTGSGQANGVNAAGTVVGTTFSSATPSVTEWTDGRMTDTGIPGYGTAINNAGQIVGGYETANGQLHAFISNGGNFVDLGTLGGNWSSANSINALGQLAGTSSTRTGVFNAFFSNGTALVDLGTLGGASSYGMAINNSGEIVGSAQTATGLMNAYSWSGGALYDLGTLGGSQSYAYGLNSAGTIVGSSWMPGNLVMHGFIDSGGVMIDLNQLLPINSGWTINAAYGINDAGDIVGTGTLNGQSYAFELLPNSVVPTATPEPASLLLAAVGLLALGKWRRSSRT